MRPTVRALTLADTGTALLLYDALTLGPKTSDAGHFGRVISHPGTTVFGAFAGSALVGMATLHLLPNVTWGGRPYGLVENVVTHPDHRNQGVGRAVIDAIRDAAQSAHAYK
ncbi:MAG: GNAT family N-acetyltransferase, partial [Pseudomonadota bacterium]